MPAVRFRVNPNHSATLAGVDYQELRSIFDAAAIHYYDQLSALRKKKRLSGNQKEELAWVKQQLKVLEQIKEATYAGLRATWPQSPERPLTKAERRARVSEARKERELLKVFWRRLRQKEIRA